MKSQSSLKLQLIRFHICPGARFAMSAISTFASKQARDGLNSRRVKDLDMDGSSVRSCVTVGATAELPAL